MAMVMWAKSAAGTNLGFVRDIGRIWKSWRETLRTTLQQKQAAFRPKVQGLDASRSEAKDRCLVQFQPSLISRSGKSLRSRIFHSVFARTTTRTVASELRRQAALRLSSSCGRNFRNMPIMSLIGVTLGVNVSTIMDDGTERMMSELQENFRGFTWKTEPLEKLPTCLNDLDINETSITNGCEGAVYKAKVKTYIAGSDTLPEVRPQPLTEVRDVVDADYDLAVKAVFNYGAESNAHSILRELEREIVPVRPEGCQLETPLGERVGRLPPHPNIVDMPGIFVDDMLVTEEGLRKFPAAMPHRLDPENFYGHNKTLYLVMRRRSSHLRDFLSSGRPVSMATRCQILAQLLEGVSHLTQHGVAHRDLKADNILVDVPTDGGCPHVEICDFGCCLAEGSQALTVAYPSRDMYLGGNTWLMAPEITTAVPGPRSLLDFTKSDLWAVGALAYEILGAGNPFYPSKGDNCSRPQLNSRTYREEDLPPLPEDVPEPVRRLVEALLARDPAKRPKASVAAAVVQMVSLAHPQSAGSLWNTTSETTPSLTATTTTATGPQSSQGREQQPVKGKTRVSANNNHHHSRAHPYYFRHHRLQAMGAGSAPFLASSPMMAGASLTRDRKWLNWVLAQGLALLCQLTLCDQSKPWDMEAFMRFQFLSRLTYDDFKEAMSFF